MLQQNLLPYPLKATNQCIYQAAKILVRDFPTKRVRIFHKQMRIIKQRWKMYLGHNKQ